jgi:myo-inositol 2-dehydrogenase / D-chiro-inositol 1-dehydrogenase
MERRTFLAGVAAAPALNLAGSAFGQSPNNEIAVGMIGVGNRGAYVMKGVMEQPGVRVAAVCDIKPDRLDKAATQAAKSNPRTHTDYRRLLEDRVIDAVFISTPCDLHVEMAIAAMQAGKHIYCEKPVGITAESIQRLLEVARKSSGKIFMAGQQMRSMERLAKTIERVHDGVAGEVIMVKAQRHASDDLAHDGPSADWFFDAKRSGDVIVEMAVHNLDVCNWVIGSRPQKAAGFGGTLLWKNQPPGRTNMDGYNAQL